MKNTNKKLTSAMRDEIIHRVLNGEKQVKLAEEFGFLQMKTGDLVGNPISSE